ncbi:MAG: PsiF family protein [Betaproteobacteria bacterium]
MKKLIAAIAIILPLFATNLAAAESKPTEKKLTPQQSKMSACSKEAKGLKGAEYKKARKECMARETAPAKSEVKKTSATAPESDKPTQKQKMASCSAENKGLKGEEYKRAQKECLSK